MKTYGNHPYHALDKQLVKYAMHLTGSRHNLSHDLKQETWLRACEAGMLLETELHVNQLRFMLRNLLLDYFKKKKPDLYAVLPEWFGDATGDKEAEAEDIVRKLYQKLREHPDGWIHLRLFRERYTLKQLAQRSGIKYSTLCKRKNRMEKDLKNWVQQHWRR